jgi:hypothetical protein
MPDTDTSPTSFSHLSTQTRQSHRHAVNLPNHHLQLITQNQLPSKSPLHQHNTFIHTMYIAEYIQEEQCISLYCVPPYCVYIYNSSLTASFPPSIGQHKAGEVTLKKYSHFSGSCIDNNSFFKPQLISTYNPSSSSARNN